MSQRTTRTIAQFEAPFRLKGMDTELPAGRYVVEVDESPIEGLSWTAYHRTGTYLHTPAIGSGDAALQLHRVDPAELEAALAQDKAEAAPSPTERARTPPATTAAETEAGRHVRLDTAGARRRARQTKRDNELL